MKSVVPVFAFASRIVLFASFVGLGALSGCGTWSWYSRDDLLERAERASSDTTLVEGDRVPRIEQRAEVLELPSGHGLRDAWLEIDDRHAAADSVKTLVRARAAEPGVTLIEHGDDRVRITFDLELYKPGRNRYVLRAVTAPRDEADDPDEHEALAPVAIVVDYQLSSGFGLRANGALALPPQHFPRTVRECRARGRTCKDADHDGLSDLWENVAVEQLRPYLLLDGADRLFRRRADQVRVLSSVQPLRKQGHDFVVFASVIAFSRDYGFHGLLDHAGDTEAFGMLYRADSDGVLRFVASTAKGHACLFCAPRHGVRAQDFAPNGAPVLYVERDKHGLWQNGPACRAEAAFSCGAQRSVRPPATNIGDPSPDGSGSLIDHLDGIAPSGPFGELAEVFPGDAVWSKDRGQVPGRFCGGSSRCSKHNSATQPGSVIRQLNLLLAREATPTLPGQLATRKR